jgi:23S rRNA (uracil747-C5)-methyltransferase
LHVANTQRHVTGIEISEQAIASANRSASELGVQIDFRALDATAFSLSEQDSPQLLIVNPPRRGLGDALCKQINHLSPEFLLYSSCNPDTLVKDLQQLRGYQPLKAQLFDMFAHTQHAEVLVLLRLIR